LLDLKKAHQGSAREVPGRSAHASGVQADPSRAKDHLRQPRAASRRWQASPHHARRQGRQIYKSMHSRTVSQRWGRGCNSPDRKRGEHWSSHPPPPQWQLNPQEPAPRAGTPADPLGRGKSRKPKWPWALRFVC